jgi:acyl-coenzyme A thioesterase PaaI-like protein
VSERRRGVGPAPGPLRHHDLCFGCGQGNLFGLMAEVARAADGSVSGRCFVKQDHQGPDRGAAHEGVVAAALCEAMSLACGPQARARAVTVRLSGATAVGTFLELRADAEQRPDGSMRASAVASCEGREVASADGSYG